MELVVNIAAGVPIYQQLAEQICGAIARGRLRVDERLPSVRDLSQKLVINPNTVARAYTELERDGTLYTRPGLGVFVSPIRPLASKAERLQGIEKQIDQVLVSAVRLGCSVDEVLEFVEERSQLFDWRRAAVAASATDTSSTPFGGDP